VSERLGLLGASAFIQPDDYVAATEMIEQVAVAVCRLLDRGTAY
jgi:cysteinyl-tRNA synthetase